MSPEVTGFLLVLAAGLSTGGEPADPLASLGVSLWKEFFTGTLDASLSLCLVCVFVYRLLTLLTLPPPSPFSYFLIPTKLALVSYSPIS